jgi:predicted transposase YbfD/YdcC
MPVKENQPTLRAEIEQLFRLAAAPDSAPDTERGGAMPSRWLRSQRVQVLGDNARWPQLRQAHSSELGHGRIEQRRLSVLALGEVPVGWVQWPGAAQVFRVERTVVEKKSGRRRQETVYGITSLAAPQASAARLLELVRGHWQIENGSHWVRDVTFEEDRSCVRNGSLPQVMAALRNTVIGLLRTTGSTNIAASHRYYAAHPWQALTLLGIKSQN